MTEIKLIRRLDELKALSNQEITMTNKTPNAETIAAMNAEPEEQIYKSADELLEDAELNAICDERKDQKRVSVNIEDL